VKRSTTLAIASLGLAAALGLAACSSDDSDSQPEVAPSQADQEQPTDEPSQQATGEISIDPAYPWPASLPRPEGVQITSEFSGPNILGEGGTWTIEFTAPSVEYVQEWVNELNEAGITFMLGNQLMRGDGEYSLAGMTDKYMVSVSVDAETLVTNFSFIGVAP
jgi:hypothetical protein